MTAGEVSGRFGYARPTSGGFMVRCPVHEDAKASLSIGTGANGGVVLKCFAGCPTDSIVEAVGLTMADLFADAPTRPTNGVSVKSHTIATYKYTALTTGEPLRKLRGADRAFVWERQSGGAWVPKLDGRKPGLYRVAELTGDLVWVDEGEKDTDRGWTLGLESTCGPHGANTWTAAHTQQLVDAGIVRAIVVPDNDPPGLAYADKVAASLSTAGLVVRVVRLPGVPKHGGDLSDFVDAGHGRADLEALAASASVWTPKADATSGGTDRTAATSGDRPSIDSTDQDLPRVTAASIAALRTWNDPPVIFLYGGVAGRLDRDDAGVPRMVELDEHRCRHALAQAASWQRPRRDGTILAAFPPVAVVRNVLASPAADVGLPVLTRIIEAPAFDEAGRLHRTPGYSAASRMFYAPARGLIIPDVAPDPAAADVALARALLLDDLLVDFPFTSDAERAHALSVVLLPFARELVDGPTPLYLVEKPTPGTGASLLVTVLLWPGIGRDVATLTEGTDEESWRKRLTSTLRSSPTAITIDNLRRRLDSAALSSAITATTWTDRILGRTENVRLPVRCVWLATGNNPALSNEISRRTIRVRLDARVDRPWLRSGFRHDPLLAWVREQRPLLVWACLTLVQRWLVAGRPAGRSVMGMFEDWSRVMGGVLDVAGVPGFLQNLDEFYDLADSESAGWRGLVERWAEKHGTAPVGVADLWRLVAPELDSGLEPLAFDFLDDAKANDRSLRTRFGKRLAAQRDRVFGGYRIAAAERKQGTSRWRLVQTG